MSDAYFPTITATIGITANESATPQASRSPAERERNPKRLHSNPRQYPGASSTGAKVTTQNRQPSTSPRVNALPINRLNLRKPLSPFGELRHRFASYNPHVPVHSTSHRLPPGQTLLFDADDTLWENNIYFERAISAFIRSEEHTSELQSRQY